MEGGYVFIQPGSLRSPGPGTALRAMGYSSSKIKNFLTRKIGKRKNKLTDICNNIDESQIVHANFKKQTKKNTGYL